MKYGTFRALGFLGLLTIVLLALRIIPSTNIGSYEIRQTDILADIITDTSEIRNTTKRFIQQDTCPSGITCIEDYAGSNCCGMQPFYTALAQRQSLNRPVRIAYFGDSFIEGDIITADLRLLLQERFGGRGVGFVDIASPFTELRPSVSIESKGWTDYNVLDKESCMPKNLGISQRYAIPEKESYIEIRGIDKIARLDTFETATLYLSSRNSQTINITSRNKLKEQQQTTSVNTSGNNFVEAISWKGRTDNVRFDLCNANGIVGYGVAIEGSDGIILDNFSLRGSSGTPLAAIPENHLKQLYTVRPYDLVILQFGLNVANKKQLRYDPYIKRMKKVINHFKHTFPHAGILIVSVGDREDKQNGQIHTIPAIPALVEQQQEMAITEKVAFWNLFEAMGGNGAIFRMAQATPAEAGKDYTHINRRGGKRIANKFYQALLHGYNLYKAQNNDDTNP